MNKVENGHFISYYKKWGNKPKCGCVEFCFDNTAWFTSKMKLALTAIITVSALVVGCEFLEEIQLKFPVMCVLTIFLCYIAMKIVFCVKKETLYVIAPVGVQFITTYVMGKESVLFIPWHTLKNFVIAEIIVGQQIFFYLGLCVSNQNGANNKPNDGLVILFQNTRPRLLQLEEMYRVIVEHSKS